MQMRKLSLDLEDSTFWQLKKLAADSRTTVSNLLRNAIVEKLGERK